MMVVGIWFCVTSMIGGAAVANVAIFRTIANWAATTVFSDTYNTATPAGTDSPTEADDRMREIKAAVQERENVDHYWPLTGTEVSDADSGEHRKVTFHESISDPTAVASHAHLFMQSDELRYRDDSNSAFDLTDAGTLNILSSDLVGTLANNTYFSAVDNAGTGTVNLIKADTNDEVVLGTIGADINLNSNTITNLAAAASAGESVRYEQLFNSLMGANESNGETTIGDMEIKWGNGSLPVGGTTTFSFVTSFSLSNFSNACFQVFVTYRQTATGPTIMPGVNTITTTGFKIFTSEGGAAIPFGWFAIGR